MFRKHIRQTDNLCRYKFEGISLKFPSKRLERGRHLETKKPTKQIETEVLTIFRTLPVETPLRG